MKLYILIAFYRKKNNAEKNLWQDKPKGGFHKPIFCSITNSHTLRQAFKPQKWCVKAWCIV